MLKYQEAILKKMKKRVEHHSAWREKQDLPYGGILVNKDYFITDGVSLLCLENNQDDLPITKDLELIEFIEKIKNNYFPRIHNMHPMHWNVWSIKKLNLGKEKETKIDNTYLNRLYLQDCIKMIKGTTIKISINNPYKFVYIYGKKGFALLMPIHKELQQYWNIIKEKNLKGVKK